VFFTTKGTKGKDGFSSGNFIFLRPFVVASWSHSFQLCQKETIMKKIYVGNLSFGSTEDTVRSLFETHGNVESVSIVTDRDTGQPRGFGFVEMTNDGEAEQAIAALNGRELDGRALNVNEARPRENRGGGGGGGRRNNRW
jgi:RNA recognition motif-containing protein